MKYITKVTAILTCCFTIVTATAIGQPAPTKGVRYLKADGKLAARLVFKDSQSGFAGVTGYIWTIEPDGSWKRQTFLNRTVHKADRSGKLSKDELKQLIGVLKANRLHGLPNILGSKPMVNPKVLSLSFGKQESKFFLRGGGQLPKVVNLKKGKRSDADRFVLIVNVIKKLLKAKSKS